MKSSVTVISLGFALLYPAYGTNNYFLLYIKNIGYKQRGKPIELEIYF